MANHSNAPDVIIFLKKAKTLISAGKYEFVPRRKNMQSLAQHGLTIIDAKNEIIGLGIEDYYKESKQDLDPNRPGDIWEFKKDIGE